MEANRISVWLNTQHHISVPDDWLEACLQWVESENQGTVLMVDDLQQLVYEQWLLSDLRELAKPCFPDGLAQNNKTHLNGFYSLQVDSVVDVGTSFYSQLQKITGKENANAAVSATQPTQPFWEPKPSRMLMMRMTDGVQDVQGMEYQPIPALNTSLTPGAKVLIQGEIMCRMGVLMLKRDNIAILGGEVEQLMETNTSEQLLKAALTQNTQLAEQPPQTQRKEFKPTPGQQQRANNINNNGGRGPAGYRGQNNNNAGGSNYGIKVAPPSQPGTWSQKPPAHVAVKQSATQQNDDSLEMPDDDLLDSMDPDNLQAMEDQWDDDMDYEAIMDQLDKTEERGLTQAGLSRPQHAHAQDTRVPVVQPGQPQGQSRTQGSTQQSNIQRNATNFQQSNVSLNRNNSSSVAPNQFQSDHRQSSMPFGSAGPNKTTVQPSQTTAKPTNTTAQQMRTQSSTQNSNNRSLGITSQTKGSAVKQKRVDQIFVPKAEPVSPVSTSGIQRKSPTQTQGNSRLSLRKSSERLSSESNNVVKVEEEEESQSLLRPLAAKHARPSKKVDLHTAPWTYLRLVLDVFPPRQLTMVRVKAYIATLQSKLESNEGREWTLCCKINDGTAAIDVDMGNEMLAELIGFTAPEYQELRNKAKTDKTVKKKLVEGMRVCQQKLVELCCILELDLSPVRPRPYVRRLIDVTPQDVQALTDRTTMDR